jgi:hypothetical protein
LDSRVTEKEPATPEDFQTRLKAELRTTAACIFNSVLGVAGYGRFGVLLVMTLSFLRSQPRTFGPPEEDENVRVAAASASLPMVLAHPPSAKPSALPLPPEL